MSPFMPHSMTHPDDGELVRLLDGVGRSYDRDRVTAHVRDCRECTTRYDQLRQRSGALAALLRTSDDIDWLGVGVLDRHQSVGTRAMPRVPRRVVTTRPDAGARRAFAAVAALVLVAVIVASPLAAWVAREIRKSGADSRTPLTTTARHVRTPTRSFSVSFQPETSEPLFWLDAVPAGGVLEVRTVAGDSPRAELIGDGSGEELVVMPNGIRIHNDSLSKAIYRLSVPSRTIRVRVQKGGRALDTVISIPPTGTRIELQSLTVGNPK